MDRSIRIQMLLVQHNLLAISVAINHTLALQILHSRLSNSLQLII